MSEIKSKTTEIPFEKESLAELSAHARALYSPPTGTNLYSSCVAIIACANGISHETVTQDQVAAFWQTIWRFYNG